MGKHRNYEPFQSGENMEEDLGMFEAAIKHPRVALEIRPIRQILMLSHGAEIEVDCRKLTSEIADRIEAATNELTGISSLKSIQSQLSQPDLGLIVLQIPFGIDADADKSHSLGSVIDGLLQTSSIPVLCLPQREGSPGFCNLDNLLVALSHEDQAALESVAWAFRLASQDSRINILEFADRSAILEARQLLGGHEEIESIQQAAIHRAVTSRLGGIIGAAQSLAHSRRLPMHIDFRLGKPSLEIANLADQLESGLIIVSRPADHTSADYHVIVDLLASIRRAVLVV